MRRSHRLFAAFLLACSAFAFADAPDLAWVERAEAFPELDEQDAAQAKRLAELTTSLGTSKEESLLAGVLARPTILALEQFTRTESQTAAEARRLRAAAVNAAMANAQVATLTVDADDDERFHVTLSGPGYWRLEGELPQGMIGWRSSCAALVHGVSDPDWMEFQPMLWRTRVVDDWRRTVTLHQGGSLMETLVVTVPPSCSEGAELALHWFYSPHVLLDASGQPVAAAERELALRQRCEQSAESGAALSTCLTYNATYEWLYGLEAGRHDKVLVGMPVLLSQFIFTDGEPVAALAGINLAILNSFPGCDDLIVSDLLRYLNALDRMAELGLTLSCDDDGVSVEGQHMPIQMQRREAPETSASP